MKGYAWKVKRSWYGRWYQDEIRDGAVVRVQHSQKLCEVSDRYRSKKDVQPLLDDILRPLNGHRSSPQGTLTVAQYGDDHFLPWAQRELKPSTVHGYGILWRLYLRPRLQKTSLRDFRCVDATNLLVDIHAGHNVGRLTLRHCKALLSGILTHAKRAGVRDGDNPVKDAGIPSAAAKSEPTEAYTPDEVLAMIEVLEGIPRAAIALTFFCGLRPGEARAARWDDYDGKVLKIRASMWNKFLTEPKTDASAGVVPVANMLAEILSTLPRIGEFILSGPSGRPVDFHNLATREVRPALERANIHWRGFYALRRGLATLATSVDSAMAAKSLLRHSNIQTTSQFYIKSVSTEAARAMDRINALVDRPSGRPN